MKRHYYIFLLLMCLLGMGCPGPEEVPTYYVSQEMLRYCWFPTGSYWIYEEDSTPGWFDSVYVWNLSHTEDLVDGEDFISESFSNDLMLREMKFRQGTQAQRIGQAQTLSYLSEFYSDSSRQLHNDLLFFDPEQHSQFRLDPSVVIANQYDSLSIGSSIYYKVIQVIANPQQNDDFTIESTWAKDVGTIHRTFADGTSWSLVRHHINR